MRSFIIIAALAMLAAGTYGGAHGLAGGGKIKLRHVAGGLALTIGAAPTLAGAAAAEGLSLYAGRGVIYTAFFVGLFAAAVLALNLKKA